MSKCSIPSCEKPLTGKQRKYCSKKCKMITVNNKFRHYENQKARGLERKKMLVMSRGGKCIKCGYNKNLAGLCFHHRDDVNKDMELNIRHLSNNSMKTILNELEKCDLVCHLCHMEIHYPDLTNWWDSPDLNREPIDYTQGINCPD
jgi:hypothetical protein